MAGNGVARTRWYHVATAFQRRVVNPVATRLGRFVPGQAVVETTGRKSGQPRHTPVGGKLDGSTFWFVSEFGRQSQYVRNILANPRVRVRIGGRWRTGVATVMDDDDARVRLRKLRGVNSLLVGAVGNELLTIRVDLD